MEKKKGGRPAYQPSREDRRLVEGMAGCGLRQEDIAPLIGVSVPTLRRHFKRELSEGKAKAGAQVAKRLFEMATSGRCAAASIFWARVHLRWRENQDPSIAVSVNHTVTRVLMPRKSASTEEWVRDWASLEQRP